MADIFGPIFSAAILEKAVIVTLKRWLPLYLQEVQLQHTIPGDFPTPRSYTTRRFFTRFPEDQLPTCIVASPGLDSDPKVEGDGSYRAKWTIHAGIIVSTSDEERTNLVAKMYGAAMRGVLLQQRTLNGIAQGTEWYDESYDDLPNDDAARSLGVVTLSFRVEVGDVVNWKKGPDGSWLPDPTTPPGTQPGDTGHVAQTVKVDINKETL